jgi:RHS repeat-associated protein
MPNRRTLRRLARTGHPVLVAPAGHRARAVPPAESLTPSEALVQTFWYSYDNEGKRTSITFFAHRPGEAEPAEIVTYDGFGKVLGVSDPPEDRYRFTGRDLESITGLQSNQARYFDPRPGRWLTEDPPDRVTTLPTAAQ